MEDIVTNTAAAKLAASSSPLPPSAKEGPVKSTKPPRWDPTIVPRTVDHTYTDYASVSDAELRKLDRDMSLSMLRSVDLTPEKKKLLEQLNEMPYKSGGSQSFPIRLHAVVSNPELSDIIAWMPHGRSFIVHDPEALVDVLTRYFNQTKFLSFVRQLNLWGFKRLTREARGKAYYHELFLRNRPYIALRIKRHKLKDGRKPIPNPNAEPNFYMYPQLEEVPVSEKSTSPAEGRSKKSIMMGRAKSSDDEEPKPSGKLEYDGTSLLKPAVSRPAGKSTVDDVDLKLTQPAQLTVPPSLTSPSAVAQATQPSHPLLASLSCASSADSQAAQLAALAKLASLRGAAVSQAFGSTIMDQPIDHLYRMAQLQRGHDELNMQQARLQLYKDFNSSMNMDSQTNMTVSGFHALIHSRNQHTYDPSTLASAVSQGAQADSFQISANESLREAQHLEELAAAARQRARNLALAAAVGAQSRYDMLVRKHASRKDEENAPEK